LVKEVKILDHGVDILAETAIGQPVEQKFPVWEMMAVALAEEKPSTCMLKRIVCIVKKNLRK